MQKFKIVLKKNSLEKEFAESSLIFENGYFYRELSIFQPGKIVDENNVIHFLRTPSNKDLSDRFFNYLNNNTNKFQFVFLKNNSQKLFTIFNDYYQSVIINNSLPNFNLIKESLKNTQEKYYKNNFFDFETNIRKKNKNKTIIELNFNLEERDDIMGNQEEELISDYFIHIFINVNQNNIRSTDYSKYLKDSLENQGFFKDNFVNLNKKNNPFEYWNDFSRFNNLQNIIGSFQGTIQTPDSDLPNQLPISTETIINQDLNQESEGEITIETITPNQIESENSGGRPEGPVTNQSRGAGGAAGRRG